MASLFCTSLLLAQPADKPGLLRDGAIVNSIDGTLTSADDTWFFQTESALTDGRNTLEPPVQLQLLPSAVLQRLIADANDRVNPEYRIWARVTTYKQQNYLFCVYFLPLARSGQAEEPKSPVAPEPQIASPNDIVSLPPEVAALLQKSEKARPARPAARQVSLEKDWTLVNRTGRIDVNDSNAILTLDAFGENVSDRSFVLLPCQELELAEKIQQRTPEKIMLKVTGIVTTFRDRNYMLLQNVTRVFSNGNFTE
jgi:hypothetical protein